MSRSTSNLKERLCYARCQTALSAALSPIFQDVKTSETLFSIYVIPLRTSHVSIFPDARIIADKFHVLRLLSSALLSFLAHYPDLRELYEWKERLYTLYRTRDYLKASRGFRRLVDDMAWSDLPEIKTLRRTLLKWKEETLRRAYGYKTM